MESLVDRSLAKKNWAVVGATQDTSKFGYKVFKKLLRHGYNVFPVNPLYAEIEGTKCYGSVSEIPEAVEVVSMIVNPNRGLSFIEDIKNKGVRIMWCQPGAESNELIKAARDNQIEIIYNECVLVELG